jgi:hypothetical protein
MGTFLPSAQAIRARMVICCDTQWEKMAIYIGTKYGNEAAQEWTSGKDHTLQACLFSSHTG